MNAQEIHDLYSPLLDEIGHPVGLEWEQGRFVQYGCGDGEKGELGPAVPLFVATTLCRSAVLDWMLARGRVVLDPNATPVGFTVTADGIPFRDKSMFGCPSFDHALVAAATALIKASKEKP